MKTYETIYGFEVIEKIKEGATVSVVDREFHEVDCVNQMLVEDLAAILAEPPSSKRYEFWIEKNTEEIKE